MDDNTNMGVKNYRNLIVIVIIILLIAVIIGLVVGFHNSKPQPVYKGPEPAVKASF